MGRRNGEICTENIIFHANLIWQRQALKIFQILATAIESAAAGVKCEVEHSWKKKN